VILSAKRVVNFKVYLVAAAAVFLVLAVSSKTYPYFPFDLWITRKIQLISVSPVPELLLFVTWLGNVEAGFMSFVIVTASFLLYGLRKEGLILGLSTVGAGAISETAKIIISRPRPDASIITQVEHFLRADSFPSGHVMFFMGFYGYLLYLSYTRLKKRRIRYFFVTIFLFLILMVGLSRIYLGSHWFSDVLGGYLLGSIWLYLVVLISGKLKI
jgi:membrane-associated phospholipid phosphatase